MRLYTHHDPDFNIIDANIDLNKSLYYGDTECSDFKKAYDWLFSIIKTNQVVWCYPSIDDFDWVHGYEEKLWTLEVPEEYVIGSIDECVWHHVINDCHYIPDEVLDNVPQDETDAVIEAWEASNEKEKTWKDYIFDKSFESQIIIKSPVKKEWVVETSWFSGYETEMTEDGMKSSCVRSNKDRDRMIEIYKAFLDGRKAQYTLEVKDKFYCFKWEVNE